MLSFVFSVGSISSVLSVYSRLVLMPLRVGNSRSELRLVPCFRIRIGLVPGVRVPRNKYCLALYLSTLSLRDVMHRPAPSTFSCRHSQSNHAHAHKTVQLPLRNTRTDRAVSSHCIIPLNSYQKVLNSKNTGSR